MAHQLSSAWWAGTVESVHVLSVVIPVFNEAPSLAELHAELHWAFAYNEGKEGTELIFVDDGSTDRSWEVLEALATKDPRVVLVRLRRNSGKSAAYAAGFREARGDVIATLDADLQDDPGELTKLLAVLSGENKYMNGHCARGASASGGESTEAHNIRDIGVHSRIRSPFDCVVGWKWQRQDPAVKVWSSRCFNTVLGWVCGTRLHDQNCGMRVIRREVAQMLPLRGDLYRMIPTLAAMSGFRVTEVPVRHRPRRFGESKYGRTGLRRTLRGFFDLLTVAFLQRFRVRPLHFFGTIGGVLLLLGIAINAYLTVIWLSGQKIGGRPLLLLGILLIVIGVQFFSTGFLADLVVASRERPDALPIAEVRHTR
jgi:glycosyltransferase involved in cell wall biosynthesis